MSDIRQIMADDGKKAAAIQRATEVFGVREGGYSTQEVTIDGRTEYAIVTEQGIVCTFVNQNQVCVLHAGIKEGQGIDYTVKRGEETIKLSPTDNMTLHNKVEQVIGQYNYTDDFGFKLKQYVKKQEFQQAQGAQRTEFRNTSFEEEFRNFGKSAQKTFNDAQNAGQQGMNQTRERNEDEMEQTRRANRDDFEKTDREYEQKAKNNPNARHVRITLGNSGR